MPNQSLVITLSKPFQFEGEKIEKIDLTGLENVTASQLAVVEEQVTAIVPEMSMNYALLLATQVSQKPITLFESLPAKDGLKVKRVVQAFLNN